jgi:hypothetical protein
MAGESAPTVEESLARINAAVTQLEVFADPGMGGGIAIQSSALADAMTAIAQAVGPGLGDLSYWTSQTYSSIGSLAQPLSQISQSLQKLANPENESGINGVRDAITKLGQDLGDTANQFVGNIQQTAAEMEADLQSMEATVGDGLNCICYAIHQLTGSFAGGLGDLAVNFDPNWEKLRDLMEDSMEAWMPRLLGPEPGHHSEPQSWLVEVLGLASAKAGITLTKWIKGEGGESVNPIVAAVEFVLTLGENLLKPLFQEATGRYSHNFGPLSEQFSSSMSSLSYDAMKWYLDLMKAGPAAPEDAVDRLGGCLGFASLAGMTAHMVSTLLSTHIGASLGLNSTGLAAMISELAGFGPILGAFQGPFFDAYLKRPWTANMNRTMRPVRPDADTLLRLHHKSRVSDKMGLVKGIEDLKKQLSYHGFSDQWIDALVDDSWTEPRRMDIQLMAESDVAADDPKWWREKALRLGYSEADAAYLKDGIKLRLARTYRDGYIHQLISQVKSGRADAEDLDSQLLDYGVPELSRQAAVALANAQLADQTTTDGIALLKVQYDRDQINDAELRDGLDGLGLTPEKVRYYASYWRLGRYHRVYLTTPTEDARQAISLYRRAYRAGVIPRARYSTMLSQAGLSDDAITVQLALDDQARDQAILTSLRQYALPLGRDAVATGKMTTGDYRNVLVAGDFPENLLEAEISYARMLRDREQTARLERRQIAPAERAYVMGLIPASALNNLYQQADYTAAEIDIQTKLLAALRTAYIAAHAKHAAARAAGATEPANAAAAAAAARAAAAALAIDRQYAASMTDKQLLSAAPFRASIVDALRGNLDDAHLSALWQAAGATPAAISLALQQIHQWAV